MMDLVDLVFLMFTSALVIFLINKDHFLLVLISLEFMVLSVYLLMFVYLYQFESEFFFSSYFLSLSVCESALGLSLLVSVIRTHGSDCLMLIDNLW